MTHLWSEQHSQFISSILTFHKWPFCLYGVSIVLSWMLWWSKLLNTNRIWCLCIQKTEIWNMYKKYLISLSHTKVIHHVTVLVLCFVNSYNKYTGSLRPYALLCSFWPYQNSSKFKNYSHGDSVMMTLVHATTKCSNYFHNQYCVWKLFGLKVSKSSHQLRWVRHVNKCHSMS